MSSRTSTRRVRKTPVADDNPFVIGLLAEGAHFADRESEVDRIVQTLTHPGEKLVVYGDRRLGKSSALERAALLARKKDTPVAVATLATASDSADAAHRVLTAVQREIGSSWQEFIKGVADMMSVSMELVPTTEPGALPSLRFNFGAEGGAAPVQLLPDTLTVLDAQLQRRKLTLGLAIDEFQRVHEWGGEDAEWALRDALQRHRRIGYVLAGSKRSLIEAMLGSKGRALWKLADPLYFAPMDDDVLAKWISKRAAATAVRIPATVAAEIVRLAKPRTRDVVQLARSVWSDAAATGQATEDAVPRALESIVREQGILYAATWRGLSARQQMILRAMAASPGAPITSAATLRRFRLGAKSSVHSAMESLIATELLARSAEGVITFDDPFFRRWVQLFGLEDIGLPVPPVTPLVG